jgi:hypothetical protein
MAFLRDATVVIRRFAVSIRLRPRMCLSLEAMRQGAIWAYNGDKFQGSRSGKRNWGVSAMRASTSASQASGSMSLSFAVVISVVRAAARLAPRSEPAKNHDFLPSANPLSARLAALFVRQMRPS